MKYFVKTILFFSILLLFCESIFSCSVLTAPPTRFYSNEFVFVGRVVGHLEFGETEISSDNDNKKMKTRRESIELEKIKKNNLIASSPRVIIEVETEINLPEKPKKYFEYHTIGIDGICLMKFFSKSEIQKRFPVGMKVNVIGYKSPFNKFDVNDENIKLNSKFIGTISENKLLGNEFDSSALAETDYSALIEPKKHLSKYTLDFELRKELKRLEFGNKEERLKILERLVYFPVWIHFNGILKNYLSWKNPNFQKLQDRRSNFLSKNL